MKTIGNVLFGLLCALGGAAHADVVYVSFDSNNDAIEKFDSANGNADLGTFANTSLATANGIAFDHQGNLYVSNSSGNTITRFDASGSATQFAAGLNAPAGLAFDAYGNLYVANNGAGNIIEIAPDGTSTTFATGLSNPTGLAFDGAGNLYVTTYGDSSIGKISPSGEVTVFATHDPGYNTLNGPMDLAFDANGNLFVANFTGSSIEKFSPDGSAVRLFATHDPNSPDSLNNPHGLAFDSSGNLFVANYHHTDTEGTGFSVIDEFSAGDIASNDNSLQAKPINSFHDANGNLRDASFIAITTNAGVPLPLVQPVPEPAAWRLFMLGAIPFGPLCYARVRLFLNSRFRNLPPP